MKSHIEDFWGGNTIFTIKIEVNLFIMVDLDVGYTVGVLGLIDIKQWYVGAGKVCVAGSFHWISCACIICWILINTDSRNPV